MPVDPRREHSCDTPDQHVGHAAAGRAGPAPSHRTLTSRPTTRRTRINTVKDYFKLPAGRTWGSTSAVDIDKDGKSIWVAERCGTNSCLDRATGQMSDLPTVLKFDAVRQARQELRRRAADLPARHLRGRDGNVWVTDGQDNAPLPARGAGRRTRRARRAAARRRRPARSVRGRRDEGQSGLQVQP